MKPDINLSSLVSNKNTNSKETLESSFPKPNKLTKIVIPGLLLVGFFLVSLWASRGYLIPAVDVKIITVIAGSSAISNKESTGAPLFQAPGWIEPEPLPTQISALTYGIISEVLVLEGSKVERNQIVAKLIDQDAKLFLAQVTANFEERRAEYVAVEKEWQNPIDQKEAINLSQAEERRLKAEHYELTQKLLLARKLLENKRKMVEVGATSLNQERIAEAEVIEIEARIAKLEAQQAANQVGTEAAQNRLKLRLADRKRLDVARAKLKEAEIQLQRAQLQLERCQIRSPIDGVVMRIMVSPGTAVGAVNEAGTTSAPIMTVYSPEHLQARVDIPMAEAAKIQIEMLAEIRLEAIAERTFRAQVTRISGQADLQRNTLPVKVKLLETDPGIKPDMLARVQFFSLQATKDSSSIINQAFAAVFILEKVIENKDGKSVVWIVDANTNQAKRRIITLGSRKQGELREVTSGLAIGDKVICQNQERLSEGVRVRIEGIE